MIKMGKIFKATILMSFSLIILSSGFANSSDNGLNESAYEQNISESNHLYEVTKTNPGFITTRGILPEMTTDTEKKAFMDLLIRASDDFPEKAQYRNEYGGPMESFGFAADGYIEIGIDTDSSENVNESTINEIYNVVKEHYEKEGIKDVPVVFVWQHVVETLELSTSSSEAAGVSALNDDGSVTTYAADEAYIDEDGNVVIVDNETTSESSNQSTSGFTSLMLLMVLFLLLITKK